MFGLGFGIAKLTTPKPEPTTINLTETQKQQIVQEARLGYISLDSAKSMIKSEIKWIPKIKWKFKDSLIVRDSLNVIDSIVYIPVYEAKDTVIQFDEITDKAEVSLAIKLKQRFYPMQEKFASDVNLLNLKVNLPKPKQGSFWEHRFILYAGLGLNYNNNQVNSGIQFGIGIRLY